MEDKEDKGFVVKDRRKFSGDETEREKEPEQTRGEASADQGQEQPAAGGTSGEDREQGSVPLPEVTLATFIFSLSSSALLHLGEIPDPDTNAVEVRLPLAKHIIDTLGMLQEKTRGNLEPDEDNLLKSVLYDLRLRYVQKSRK
jgi:hypothetical protein